MKDASSAIGFDGIENEPMIDLTSRTSALTRARMRVQEVDVFWAGTAALTAGLAAVLGWFLHAWPPHEDEALALFVGRGSLGSVLHTVIAERGLFVVLRRERMREALVTLAVLGVVATPFWWADLVLRNRFDVGVGGGGPRLGSPRSVLRYFWWVSG